MIICFDTETTGLADEDEIIQLSIANAETGEELMNEYFRPSDDLMQRGWDDAAAITGITPARVANCRSLSDQTVHEAVQGIINSADVVVGYHVAYDVNMMERAGFDMSGCVYQDPMYGFASYYWSTHPDEKHVTKRGKIMSPFMKWKDNGFGGKGQYVNKSLGFAAEFFGIVDFGAHDSMNDVNATISVWKHMVEKHNESIERAREVRGVSNSIIRQRIVVPFVDELGSAMVTPLGAAFSYMPLYTRKQLAVLDA